MCYSPQRWHSPWSMKSAPQARFVVLYCFHWRGETILFTLFRQHIGRYFRAHRVVSVVAGHVAVMAMLALSIVGPARFGVFAEISCPKGDTNYTVMDGDTLSGIAANHDTTWQ